MCVCVCVNVSVSFCVMRYCKWCIVMTQRALLSRCLGVYYAFSFVWFRFYLILYIHEIFANAVDMLPYIIVLYYAMLLMLPIFFFSVATFLLPLLLPLWSIILCVRSLFPALFGWNSIFLTLAGYSTSMCATFTCYFSAKILILYAYTKLQNTKYVVG